MRKHLALIGTLLKELSKENPGKSLKRNWYIPTRNDLYRNQLGSIKVRLMFIGDIRMSREYLYEEVGKHTRALIELFLEGGYPPYVIDEVMDNLKDAYKRIFKVMNSEQHSPFEIAEELIQLISQADIEQAKKNEILNELERLRK